ncbi:DUF3307 domain-containing protein [Caproiciproducens sp. R2]|uniref:DUF3307 domain-containing protein n=1 Tax=Caproiciproducens sp. R2 TaxID=3435187 RepID=UPI004033FA1C
MYKNLLILFVLLHVLGDFYLQTDTISEKKIFKYKYVVLHSILYAAVFCVGTILIWSMQIAIAVFVLSVLHFLIDSVKYLYSKYDNSVSESIVYCTDQWIHILSLIITVIIFKYCNYNIAVLPEAKSFLSIFTDNGMTALRWSCIILIVCKPANITIKKILSQYKPGSKDGSSDKTIKNVGAFIGTLERMIIVLLLSVNQYAAIGLVLTAKSVARYDKISKEPPFAEYYLLGTLLSTLLVILTYLLLCK